LNAGQAERAESLIDEALSITEAELQAAGGDAERTKETVLALIAE
jgi:hypothetical protein